MRKEEFENRLIELIEEYTKTKLPEVAQNLTISINATKLPEIAFNGILIEKE